jgi:hypothetical protein
MVDSATLELDDIQFSLQEDLSPVPYRDYAVPIIGRASSELGIIRTHIA